MLGLPFAFAHYDSSIVFLATILGAEENVPVGPLEFDPLCRSIASTGTLHKRQHSVSTMALLPNEVPSQLARGQQATNTADAS